VSVNTPQSGCVYRLTFPNGKSYIGATRKTADERFKVHLSHSKRLSNSRHSKAVHHAIAKYGVENVLIETLLVAEITQCFDFEIKAIEKFKTRAPNGYNLTDGGEGVHGIDAVTRLKISAAQKGNTYGKGKIPSIEKRQKISLANMGHFVSQETREKIGAVHKGKPLDVETKKKISDSLKGRLFSQETRKKISEAMKGVPLSADHIKKLREAKLGKKSSPETRAKQSASLKGRIMTPEHKEKIRAAHIARLNAA
jgi:group I intron endonuclease